MNVYTIILVFALSHVPKHRAKKGSLRVSNGYNDTSSTYPYVVVMLGKSLEGHRICTGSLISPIWGLTAAHCLIKPLTYIQYGDISVPLNITKARRRILQVISHPSYIKINLKNDIAMFRVNPVNLNTYGKLSAVEYIALSGLPVTFTGFGMTLLPNSKKSDKRKQKKISSLDMPLQLGNGIVVNCGNPDKHYICVHPKCSFKQYTMSGDSGGPLFVDNKIIGVLSGRPGTEYEDSERFYSPVSRYLPWISKMIAKYSKKKLMFKF